MDYLLNELATQHALCFDDLYMPVTDTDKANRNDELQLRCTAPFSFKETVSEAFALHGENLAAHVGRHAEPFQRRFHDCIQSVKRANVAEKAYLQTVILELEQAQNVAASLLSVQEQTVAAVLAPGVKENLHLHAQCEFIIMRLKNNQL